MKHVNNRNYKHTKSHTKSPRAKIMTNATPDSECSISTSILERLCRKRNQGNDQLHFANQHDSKQFQHLDSKTNPRNKTKFVQCTYILFYCIRELSQNGYILESKSDSNYIIQTLFRINYSQANLESKLLKAMANACVNDNGHETSHEN